MTEEGIHAMSNMSTVSTVSKPYDAVALRRAVADGMMPVPVRATMRAKEERRLALRVMVSLRPLKVRHYNRSK